MRAVAAGRTLVVGDVHGCLGELERLLRRAGWKSGDGLVLVGDLVAKGPDSAGVLALCREKGARSVLGNHDDHVCKTKGSTLHQTLPSQDLAWLKARPLLLELPEHGALVVHGGLVAGVPLDRQERRLLLNMRSIDPRGRATTSVEGGVPWASRWPGPSLVLFGHDAVRGLQQYPLALGLDTGCVYGGRLTGVWLPERRLVSVPARRVWHSPDRRPRSRV